MAKTSRLCPNQQHQKWFKPTSNISNGSNGGNGRAEFQRVLSPIDLMDESNEELGERIPYMEQNNYLMTDNSD
ncbi:hypothetical protein ACE6H2_006710 [Prunus campanulata]